MATQNQFSYFLRLPIELRLQIYSYALPSRILQMGFDFPFPSLPDPKNLQPHYLRPTIPIPPTHLPSLFYVCQESRTFCLSIYIPFAYTYAHPTLDTLYISQRASQFLCHILSTNAPGWQVRTPLYPTAILDCIVVGVGVSRPLVLGDSIVAQIKYMMGGLGSLGYPRKLLLARGTQRTGCDRFRGWENMIFVDVPLGDEARDKMNIAEPAGLVDFVQRNLHEDQTAQDTEWLSFHVPEVRCVYATAKGELNYCQASDTARYQGPATKLAQEWLEAEQKSGPPKYDMKATAKALHLAGISWPEI